MNILKLCLIVLVIASLAMGGYYVARKNKPASNPQTLETNQPAVNLSYLVLTTDANLFPLITDPTGNQVGTRDGKALLGTIPNSTFTKEASLYDSANPGTEEGVPYWNLEVKYPETGEYTLEFNSPKTGEYIFELYSYDQEGEASVEKQSVSLKANTPKVYKLNYSQTGEYPPALLH